MNDTAQPTGAALPGLDAIRRRRTELSDSSVVAVSPRERDALATAVETLALIHASAQPDSPSFALVLAELIDRADTALAPFRTRDVTPDEVPQRLIDDVLDGSEPPLDGRLGGAQS